MKRIYLLLTMTGFIAALSVAKWGCSEERPDPVSIPVEPPSENISNETIIATTPLDLTLPKDFSSLVEAPYLMDEAPRFPNLFEPIKKIESKPFSIGGRVILDEEERKEAEAKKEPPFTLKGAEIGIEIKTK